MAKNILKNFQKECDDYLTIISSELEKGNFKEALQRFHEMITVYSGWLVIAESPGKTLTAINPDGQKIEVDMSTTKELARERINMLSPIIKKSRDLFKKYKVYIKE